MRPTTETALLVGNYLPSLAAARALAGAGYRIVAGDGGEYSTVRHSRYCAEVWRHPPVSDREGFVNALATFLAARHEITTVLPLQERYVESLALAKARLPEGVTLAAPDASVVTTCLDKHRMHMIAAESGVPSRPLAIAEDSGSLLAAAEQVGYPCVIRPKDRDTRLLGDAKATICRDRPTLERLLAVWPEKRGRLLVQRYLAGPRHNVYFIAKGGQILARLESRVLRTDRLDGTGVAVEEVTRSPDPRLIGYCDVLVDRLGYSGVGSAQFIVPDDGHPSFLEVNPRHDAAAAGVEVCGLPLTLAAIDLASGAGRWRPDPAFRSPVGRRFAWTSRDLYGLGMAISRREIGARSSLRWLADALRSAARADVHLTWSRRDPLPTLALYVHLATLGPWRRRTSEPRSGLLLSDRAGGGVAARSRPETGGRRDA